MFGFHADFDQDPDTEHEHDWGHHWARHHRFGGKFRGFGPFGGPFGEGGRKRQRRGDIKFILLELIKEQPRHGYDVIKVLEERYGGFYRPSPGTVYPTLQLLEDEGNVSSATVDGKRIYTITEAGEKLLEQREKDHGEDDRPWRRGFGGFGGNWEKRSELRHSIAALAESIIQAGRYGTPEQVKAVQDLLTKTNQEIHTILAQGSESEEL